jgi:DNA (cytosine-5)-methyltransferase 1
MARIIGEVRPKYAFVENSPMLTTRGLGTVLRDLAEMGYDAEWGVLGAADVGANHQRDRIWILAYSNSKSDAQRRFDSSISEIGGQRSFDKGRSRGNVDGILESSSNEEMDTKQRDILSHTEHNRVRWGEQQSKSLEKTDGKIPNSSSENVERHELPCRTSEGFFAFGSHRWWSIEPNLDRVAHGVAFRVDRLKAIGNGQVPLCAATAWSILMERINGL